MNTYVDKTQVKGNQAVVRGVAGTPRSGESVVQIADNRAVAIFQNKLQETVNNSTQSQSAALLQTVMNDRTAQLKSYTDAPLNGIKPSYKSENDWLHGTGNAVKQKKVQETRILQKADALVGGVVVPGAKASVQCKPVAQDANRKSINSHSPGYSFQVRGVVQRNEEDSEAGIQFKAELKTAFANELITIAKAYFPQSYYLRWKSTINNYVEGVLNTHIRTYGLKNRTLIKQKIQQSAGTLGEKSAQLLDQITKGINQLPETMQTSKNKEIVKIALYPAAIDQFASFKEQYLTDQTIKFATMRVAMLSQNLRNVDKRIRADWDRLKPKFNLTGDVKFIHLTGSDFHNEGQQVAIVESTTGSNIVYKPRTVSPDKALIGEEGVFQGLNKISYNTVQLPTMKFEEVTEEESGETYSYAEFQQKESVKTEDEIETYYMRYGQLAVASKLSGVNDLHYENIMSVKESPTIIDAETSFLPYILSSVDFAKTGIKQALSSFKDNEGLVNTSFYTTDEKNKWNTTEELRSQYADDFSEYVQAIRREDLKGEANYLYYFEIGINNMLDLIKTNKEAIIEMMLEKISNVHHIRVVPFKTQDFTGLIKSYNDWLEEGDQDRADEVVTSCVTQIKKAIIEKSFSIISTAFIATTLSIVGKGIKTDFSRADTPILHFDPKKNELTYHDQAVAMSNEWVNPKAAITRVVTSVGEADVEKVKTDLLS